MDGQDIKRWRSLNRIKQEALASMLGVSHVAVSKWENGMSRPSKAIALRLQDVMSGVHQGKLAAEVAFIQPLQQIKMLTRGLDMQLVGFSSGFLNAFPELDEFRGKITRPYLVNEARYYREQSDLFRECRNGEVLMITGVSNRMVRIGSDVPQRTRLRWHTIVRHIDGELIHDVVLEPCPDDTPVGFEKVLRRGDIAAAY